MPGTNPQSSVPDVPDRFNWQRNAARIAGMFGDTEAPKVLTATGTVIDNTPGGPDARAGEPVNIILQNDGTAVAAFAINSTADLTKHTYNFLLAAGTADEDGKGGTWTLPGFIGKLTVAFGSGTARVATIITYAK